MPLVTRLHGRGQGPGGEGHEVQVLQDPPVRTGPGQLAGEGGHVAEEAEGALGAEEAADPAGGEARQHQAGAAGGEIPRGHQQVLRAHDSG